MEKIFVTLWILFGIYTLVLVMILADLWSGVRKAHRMGVMRTSYGYKRTVSKLAQYYNVLIALSIVDCMQMSTIWYLEAYYQYSLWLFPFITLIGAIALCLIEVKSIYEKAEDKVRLDQAGQTISKIVVNRDNLEVVVKAISDYMKESDNSKTEDNEPNTD